jgi:hypothetical protein
MALTQVASGLIASVAGSTITGTQTIPKSTLPTGSVLQVVYGSYAVETSVASTSYTDTGLSVSITPTSATSKILILVSQAMQVIVFSSSNFATTQMQIVKNGSSIIDFQHSLAISAATNGSGYIQSLTTLSKSYLDSPASTSALTYKTQGKNGTTSNSYSATYQPSQGVSTMILMEIAA